MRGSWQQLSTTETECSNLTDAVPRYVSPRGYPEDTVVPSDGFASDPSRSQHLASIHVASNSVSQDICGCQYPFVVIQEVDPR